MLLAPNLTRFFSAKSTQTQKKTPEDTIAQANAYLAPEVSLTFADQRLTVWLSREEKRNAMSFAMMNKLIWLAGQIADWREIRSVILAGQGKSFCTGIDLADLNNQKNLPVVAWELLKPTQSKFQKVCLVWRELPVPVIAVLHGHCFGAGLQLAMACDIRISTPDCEFAIMEAKWGLVPDMGITQSGFGVLRADTLKELTMTARVFDGTQALEYGVVSYVNDNPMQYAQALAKEIAQRSPDAVLASKRLINKMYQQSATTLYQEKLWQVKMLMSKNRPLAVKKAKESGIKFVKRQFS